MHTLFPVQLCKETCILLCPACCIVDPDTCPAGRWRPLYIPLHILTVYSVTADQTITAPPSSSPQTLLLCSRMDLIFSGSVSSRVWWQADKCGLCVSTCLLSGPLGCLVSVCVSTPQRLTATPSSRMWKKAFQQNVWIICRIWEQWGCRNLFYSARVGSLLCKTHTPQINVFISNPPPFSNHEHEPFHRTPNLFTSLRCLMYSVQRGMCFMSNMTEKGNSSGFVNQRYDLLLVLFKKNNLARANRGSCGFSFHFSFSIVFACRCFCLFYLVV